MKIRNFLLITALACSTSAAYALFDRGEIGGGGVVGNTATGAVPNSLSLASSISLVNNASINVIVTPGVAVDAYFLANVGKLSLVMRNSSGAIVYNQSVNTGSVTEHSIDISYLPSDAYTLSFINSAGKVLQVSNFVAQ